MEILLEIAKKIQSHGGNLYLVGGAVRDELSGHSSSDKDFCVTGLTKGEFSCLFPDAILVGNSFEVFLLESFEFALARKETKTGLGHNGFSVQTGKDISIEEDLARRDLTINSIAKNVLTGEIIDPFCGREDIKNQIIRATTNAFKEDPLRVYRAARFASTLGFEISEETLFLMYSLKNELTTLSPERVFHEFEKALASPKPSIFFETLKKADVLDIHFSEIAALIGSLQPEKYHPEGDSFNHTMQVVDYCASLTPDLAVRFSALVHDLGKGITPKELYPHHYGHDVNGPALVTSLGNRIKAPRQWIEYGRTACKEHMLGGIFGKMSTSKKVNFLERVDHSSLGLLNLQLVVKSDRNGRGSYQPSPEEDTQSEFYPIGRECLDTINGDWLKEKFPNLEGKAFGEKLHEERVKWLSQKLAKKK